MLAVKKSAVATHLLNKCWLLINFVFQATSMKTSQYKCLCIKGGNKKTVEVSSKKKTLKAKCINSKANKKNTLALFFLLIKYHYFFYIK